jgi:hypothetical protein
LLEEGQVSQNGDVHGLCSRISQITEDIAEKEHSSCPDCAYGTPNAARTQRKALYQRQCQHRLKTTAERIAVEISGGERVTTSATSSGWRA